eukprot:TRINITY_DN6736_c0_g1_i1.p1 TRINITY_DN6736_c0_g1~~TRINITY_DN6736_c0_g1_i1.p1  ORF type:complete len:544 (-),score=59.13 TRINITY_DN6736_c0_g1_i1:327-1862(-)
MKHLHEIRMLAARPIPDSNAVDPIGEEVSRLMQERQKEGMQICSSVVCHAVSVFLVGVLFNIFTRSPRWASFEQLVVLLVLLSFALALDSLASFDYKNTALYSYSIFMGLSAMWVVAGDFASSSSASAGEVTLYTSGTACAMRLLATVNVLHFRIALFWNVVCSIVSSCKFVYAKTEAPFPNSNLVFLEAIFCITVMLISEGIRSAKFAETFQEVSAAAGNIEKSATTTLLEAVCDVILPLDPNLTISEDVPRFKGMLLLNPNSSVEGLRIDNYIPSQEDKTRLYQQITSSCSKEDSGVRCLNVVMRDSDGNNIKVEMFSVAFEALNKSRRYMLGIREFSDLQVRPAPLRRTLDHDQGSNSSGTSDFNDPSQEPAEVPQRSPHVASSEAGSQEVESRSENQSDLSNATDVAAARTSSAMAAATSRETCERAKLATTIATIASWKVKTSKTWCCEMHAGLPEAKRMLKMVRKQACMNNLHTNPEQCSVCGVLERFNPNGLCNVCGQSRRISL